MEINDAIKYSNVNQSNDSIWNYLQSQLSNSKYFSMNQQDLKVISQKLHDSKKKGEEHTDLIEDLEVFIEDRLTDISTKQKLGIKKQIKSFKVESQEVSSFYCVLKVLKNCKMQECFINTFSDKYSSIIIENPFDEQLNYNNQSKLFKILENQIQQVKWNEIFLNLSDADDKLLNQLQFILPLYPYLKQWIYLKKSLNQLMNKAKQLFSNKFPFIESLTSQDLIVLLYFLIPIYELKLLGDYLTNSCIPLPFIIKQNLIFYESLKTSKSIVTYINTPQVKQEDSCFFCSRILCQDSSNNFNGQEIQLTFNKSIQLVTKIPHSQGLDKYFIRINDYNLNENYNYTSILSSLISQTETLIIHAQYNEIMKLNSFEQQGEVYNKVQMSQRSRKYQKIIFVSDKKLKQQDINSLKIQVKKFLNHDQILFADKDTELIQIWRFINSQDIQCKQQFIYQNIFQELNILMSPKTFIDQIQPIQNKQQIEKIIEDVEKEQSLLLRLNNQEKDIIDLKLQKVKVRINIDLEINESEVNKLDLQILKLENSLKQMKVNPNVVKILDSVLRFQDISRIVDQNKVLQLKMIIQSIRGKYNQQYSQKYLDISKQIQDLELSIQSQEYKENYSQIKLNKEIQQFKDDLSLLDRRNSQKEITFDMIVNEINIAQERSKYKHPEYKQTLEQLFLYYYLNGLPMKLIEGNTLQFGNAFLREIASQILDKDLFVISIVGLQSSAKSTLLNQLFQVDFAVGNGRVTKGLYFARILFENKPVIIIDTEGLMSLVGRDQQYDNSVMAIIFLISNIVIFNQKGEANKQIKELLELCGNIVQQLLVSWEPPTVIFALRDQNDVESQENIEKQKIQLVNSISNENAKKSMEIKTEHLILFPPAFNEQLFEGVKFKQANQIFSAQVLKLRKMILNIIDSRKQRTPISFKQFYDHGFRVWEQMKGNCSNLIIARNLKEYQDKMDLQLECQEATRNALYEIKSQFQCLKDSIKFQKGQNLQEQKNNIQKRLELEQEKLFHSQIQNIHKLIIEKCEQLRIENPNIIEMQKKMTKSEFDRQLCIEKQDFLSELQDKLANLVMQQQLNEIEENAYKILKTNKNKNCISEVKRVLIANFNQFKKINEEEFSNSWQAKKIKIETNWRNSFDKFKQEKNLQNVTPILYKFYDSFFAHANDSQNQQQKQNCKLKKKGFFFGLFSKSADAIEIENQLSQEFDKSIIKYNEDLIQSILDQKEIQLENVLKQLILKQYQHIELIQKQYKLKIDENFKNFMAKFMINKGYKLYDNVIYEVKKYQQEKKNSQIQDHQNKVEQTLKDIQCILDNTDNASVQGNSFMQNNLIPAIIENFMNKITKSLKELVKSLIRDNIDTPTKENKMAFSLCWDGKELNKDNLIKFYLDTPKFIKEMIHKRIESQRNKISQIEKTKMNNKLIDLKHALRNKLGSMISKLENQQVDFQDYIKSQLNEFTEDFPNLKLFMLKEFNDVRKKGFINGMIEGFELQQQFSTKQVFEKKLDMLYQVILKEEVVDAIGCCQKCPHCGAKCILKLNHEGTHDVDNQHRFGAYQGIRNIKTNEFCKVECYESIPYIWKIGDKEYPDMNAMNQDKYPTWVEHFKNAEAQKLTMNHDSNFQKMAYYLIGEWFGNHQNSKRSKENQGIIKVPQEWQEFVTCYPQIDPTPVDPKKQFEDY